MYMLRGAAEQRTPTKEGLQLMFYGKVAETIPAINASNFIFQ